MRSFRRLEPRTPGTKRAVLNKIINTGQSKTAEDMENILHHVEELMQRCETLAGRPLDEGLSVTVVVGLLVKYPIDRLVVATKDTRYTEVHEQIMSYIDRRHDAFEVKRMDVDNHEGNGATPSHVWWGGAGNSGYDGYQSGYSYPEEEY